MSNGSDDLTTASPRAGRGPCNGAARTTVHHLPQQWMDASAERSSARTKAHQAGFVAGTRYGMQLGCVWGFVLTVGAVALADTMGWLAKFLSCT